MAAEITNNRLDYHDTLDEIESETNNSDIGIADDDDPEDRISGGEEVSEVDSAKSRIKAYIKTEPFNDFEAALKLLKTRLF